MFNPTMANKNGKLRYAEMVHTADDYRTVKALQTASHKVSLFARLTGLFGGGHKEVGGVENGKVAIA